MYRFEQITERDVDFTIMRALMYDEGVRRLFLNTAGLQGGEVLSIAHSVTDPVYGETDITVVLKARQGLVGLLIENKIDAQAQPSQYARYLRRGQLGVERGDYDAYTVLLVAPSEYIATNEEARKYPKHISYEALIDTVENGFDMAVLKAALDKHTSGYRVIEVPSVTRFWRDMYEYCRKNHPNIVMYEPKGAKGGSANWMQFYTGLKGTSLYYKSSKGFVDLEFSGKRDESSRLKRELLGRIASDMRWADTGKSVSLRLTAPAVDVTKPFESYTDIMPNVLGVVERLAALTITLDREGYKV